jgi:hypothetical protein
VGKAIRAYVTNTLQKPVVPPIASLPPNAADYAGWYVPDSPRVELVHFLERLVGLSLIRVKEGRVRLDLLGGWNETYVPVAGAQFRHVPKKDPPDPVATFELLTPNAEGRFIQAGLGAVMKRIPMAEALAEIVATAFVLLSMVSILVYAPFWILGGLSKRRRRPAERGMRIWALLAVLCLITFVGIFIACSDDLIVRLGNLTGWSAAIFLTTLAYGIAAAASTFTAWRTPAESIRPSVRRFSRIVSVALLISAVYLAYWGIVGLRTWV